MTDQDKGKFLAAMVALYKAFGKDEDKDITRICYFGLQHLSLEDATECISLAIQNGQRFPTVYDLKKYVAMIPARKIAIAHTPARNAKLADDASTLMNLFEEDKISKENLIEGMLVFEQKYPNVGWKQEAVILAAHYSRGERECNGTNGKEYC